MNEYPKIHSPYKRDHDTGKLLEGEWSLLEFGHLKDIAWIFTEKVDGTNIRVMWDGLGITYAGKTDKAQIPAHLAKKLNKIFSEKEPLFKDKFGDTPVCLYGEGYGVKIQSGGKYLSDRVSFVLFDIKIGKWWLKREDVLAIADEFCLDIVPIVGMGTLTEAMYMVRKGLTSRWGAFEAEGIVAKPVVDLFCRNGQRVMTKIKARDFKEEADEPVRKNSKSN